MDFGVLGLHGLLSSNTNTSTADAPNGFASSHLESKHKRYGSGFLKQERSGPSEDDWRSSKLSKTKPMLPQQKTTLDPSSKSLSFSCIDNENKEPQMLSFSLEGSTQNATLFPCFHFPSPALSSRSSGYSFGIYGGGRSMQLGVFTESQWMELEHQALIYKYITANVPVPNHLLVSIRKAMESTRLYFFPGSLLRPNTLGWEAFHLGFSGNTDPEPGRCRRTDGKKWRCSRDVVADQKYCERHINRGRHRSRKPVEGQLGHSAAASTTTTANIPKGFLATSANAVASTVVGSQGSSVLSSFPVSQQQQQLVNFSPACSHNLSTSSLSRTFPDKWNMVSADSIFNPLYKNSSFMNGGSFSTEQGVTCGENVMQHSLPPFMDDWPNKSQSDTSAASWPEFNRQLDKTQLSISIPMATADYMSATSSPNNDRMILSPPRLKGKFDPVHMGLGVGSVLNEPNKKHANWIPMSWETSVGGPLGEVLNRTNKISSGKCKDSSALNLMTKGWDSSTPFGSPTGVLPKTTFDSLLTSSIGSSPRADNKTSESVSVGNALVQF